MIFRSLLLFTFVLFSSNSFAQTYTISGRSVDADDLSALIGVNAIVKGITDSSINTGAVSDLNGNFELNNVNPGKYAIQLVYLGYKTINQTFTITNKNILLGNILMKTTTTKLTSITVKEKAIRAQQMGDTSQFRADAYKAHKDATAEDLLTKMPGITSDGNGVKVNGEAIQQILVDGKPFFGSDPNMALKNLPAEIIDKIQVFDKLSDQSAFTGFDDGNGQKAINIITKGNHNEGTFGKAYVGYGTDERYSAGGNLNTFKGDTRISLLGMSNNINQQNFSSQDILGISGGSGQNRGGGGRGGGGNPSGNFLVGQQGGITTTNSYGINYSDVWGKKMKVSGSYFYNKTDNESATDLAREYFTTGAAKTIYKENYSATANNKNHRINLKFEYAMDSFNTITFTPALALQSNSSYNSTIANSNLGDVLSSQTINRNTANNKGFSSSGNNLLIQHKFRKPRRTLSLNVGASLNEKSGSGSYYSSNTYYAPDTFTLRDQVYNLYNNSTSISPNVTYTEPIGKKGQVMANYSPSFSQNSADKETYDTAAGIYDLNPLFSNKYENTYNTQKGGLSYRIGDKKLNFNFGANMQYATLSGQQVYPNTFALERNFTNVLPSAMFNYRYADGRNLRIMYRTNTNAPSVTQLQNLIDISNPILIRTGNAYLKQDYQHTFIVRYGATKAKTAHNFFVNLYANYVNDYIGNSSIIPDAPYLYRDSFTNTQILVNRGSQLTRPVNMDGYLNSRSFVTYGLPFDFLKSNLNLNGGFNFTRTPGLINGVQNYSNNYTPSFGLVLSSNISTDLDFTLSYNGNYNIVNNTAQPQANNNYYSHTAAFKVNWIFLKNFVVNTNVTDNYYTAFSSTGDQHFFLWNAYVGYKFLKERQLEARITAFDILNQNKSITRTVTETYVENNVTQVLQQYFMLQLTYTLRDFRTPANAKPVTDEENGPRPPGSERMRDH